MGQRSLAPLSTSAPGQGGWFHLVTFQVYMFVCLWSLLFCLVLTQWLRARLLFSDTMVTSLLSPIHHRSFTVGIQSLQSKNQSGSSHEQNVN